MTNIQWNDELDVGQPLIDEQHRNLFAIANDLIDAINAGKGEATLEAIFIRLREYTEYHFKAEEKYMKEIEYPKLGAHAAQHAILLLRVGTLQNMIRNGESISPEGVSIFMRDWITQHIMEEDADIGEFAQSLD